MFQLWIKILKLNFKKNQLQALIYMAKIYIFYYMYILSIGQNA